jgi:hypothetical protein
VVDEGKLAIRERETRVAAEECTAECEKQLCGHPCRAKIELTRNSVSKILKVKVSSTEARRGTVTGSRRRRTTTTTTNTVSKQGSQGKMASRSRAN